MPTNPTFSVLAFVPRLRSITIAALEDLRYREPATKQRFSPAWLPFMWLQAASNTFGALSYLCANDAPDENRKMEYVLAAPALSRVVLEALFNTILLLDDPPNNSKWFNRSHWRETIEERLKLQQRHDEDPAWAAMIEGYARVRDMIADRCGLPLGEVPSYRDLAPRYWPTPSRMARQAGNTDRRRLLDTLDDQFYGELSSLAHLKGSGLTKAIVPFVMDVSDPDRSEGIEKLRAKYFVDTAMFLTAILSELEITFHIGIRSDLRQVWEVLPTWRPEEVRELYEQHYRARLATS